ncbi:MAG TPA: Ig-like domain-containing protein [Gemmatimonadaceae bacterium]|nr:Ig-like domain-containing protein [Gemmatimonadaceae bacterium]
MHRPPPSQLVRAAASLALLSLGAALGACGDKKLGPSVPASVNIVSGDSQTVLAGNHASIPLVAAIVNSDGAPLPNVTVRWSVTTGGGSLETVVATTDANGRASTIYRSPALVGTATVTASAGQEGRPFTVLIVADTTGSLFAYGGDGAAALVGVPLTLTARATDRFGNPISGVDVTWSSSSGQLQATSSTTDSTGKASNVITVGPDTGSVSITATSRFNSVNFTVFALPSS